MTTTLKQPPQDSIRGLIEWTNDQENMMMSWMDSILDNRKDIPADKLNELLDEATDILQELEELAEEIENDLLNNK